MLRNLLVRLLDTLPTLLLVLTLVFVAMRILPGDPAVAVLGDAATQGQLEIFREKLGLNVPIWQQYINFLGGMLHPQPRQLVPAGHAGDAADRAQPCPTRSSSRVVAVILGSVVGIPLGVLAAAPAQQGAGHRRAHLLAHRLRHPRLLSRGACCSSSSR